MLKGSVPEITASTTTIPNISPSIAPANSSKIMAPIIIGISDSGGVKLTILILLAKVCKTIMRAASMPIPTKRPVFVFIVFIFSSC